MSEPVVYSLVLKSVNGILPTGAANTGVFIVAATNADLTFYGVQNLLARIKSDYNCQRIKMELSGALMITQTAANSPTGIDIVVSTGGGLMNTFMNSGTSNSADKIIGCVNPAIASTFTISASEIAYKSPIYINDIDSVSHIRLVLLNALTYASTGATSPSYSIELIFTPCFG